MSQSQRILSMDEKDQLAYAFFQHMRLKDEYTSPLVITTSSRNNDITLFSYNARKAEFTYSDIPDYAENRSILQSPPTSPFYVPRFETTPGYIREIAQVDFHQQYRPDLYSLKLHAMNSLQIWLQFHVDQSTGEVNYQYRPRVLVPRSLFDKDALSTEFAQLYHLNVLLSPPNQKRLDIQCIVMNAFDLNVTTGPPKRLTCRFPGDKLSVDMNRVIHRLMELK